MPETTPTREELLPCPFCGGSACLVEATEAGPNAWCISCNVCGASSGVSFPEKVDPLPHLQYLWNRRSALREAVPEGWVLVPREPDEDMYRWGIQYHRYMDGVSDYREVVRRIWGAMIVKGPVK